VLGSERLDGALVQGLPAAGRTVWSREYGADLMCLSQCIERRNGELRCAGETQPEGRKIGAQGSKSRRGSARRHYAGHHCTGIRCPGFRRANITCSGSLSTLFFQAPANQLALELGEVIDE
jgi:hypothetical protein